MYLNKGLKLGGASAAELEPTHVMYLNETSDATMQSPDLT